MNSKKKLLITISAFVVVFAGVIAAVVAIFAAQQQGVKSTFKVTYRATNVAVSVRANVLQDATTTPMLTDDGRDILVFLPEQAQGTGNLSPENNEIEIEGQTSSVVFEYIFANNSNTVDVAISLESAVILVTISPL